MPARSAWQLEHSRELWGEARRAAASNGGGIPGSRLAALRPGSWQAAHGSEPGSGFCCCAQACPVTIAAAARSGKKIPDSLRPLKRALFRRTAQPAALPGSQSRHDSIPNRVWVSRSTLTYRLAQMAPRLPLRSRRFSQTRHVTTRPPAHARAEVLEHRGAARRVRRRGSRRRAGERHRHPGSRPCGPRGATLQGAAPLKVALPDERRRPHHGAETCRLPDEETVGFSRPASHRTGLQARL